MTLQQRVVTGILTVVLGLSGLCAETLTSPPESLNGLRPGTLTIDDVQKTYGKPDVTTDGGLLGLYGGAEESRLYGWYMIENPSYTVPDLAVETASGSKRVDLVMAIGFDGLKTEKGLTCFQSEEELIRAYGVPDFVFAVPMQGFVLRELYYVDLGISFDVAPMDAGGDRAIAAIYVTYPEYLRTAIEIRKKYISQGVGRDITNEYKGVTNT